MPRDVNPRVRADVLARMQKRARGLLELIETAAPDILIANGAVILGQLAAQLAPYDIAEREAETALRLGRSAAGICLNLDCDHDARFVTAMMRRDFDGYCATHQLEMQLERAKMHGGSDVPS